MVTDRGEGPGEWAEQVKWVKRYKLPVIDKSQGYDKQHDDYSQ